MAYDFLPFSEFSGINELMRRLCFGGSFNPIHHGHLICARAVAEAAGFDRIVLIPSAQPPHKPDSSELAQACDRLAMCRLAVRQNDAFQVDDIELERTGPSFTIDTVRELKRRGNDELAWLIGADMLQILPQWHDAEELIAAVTFLVMARPGIKLDFAALPPAFRALRRCVVAAPLIDISATDIRARVAAGRSIDYLTPPAVVRYIQTHRLYRT